MTGRHIANPATDYTLTYDAENRLVGVSGSITATFTYDADGNRVKTVIGSTTTFYFGNYYEVSGGTVTKYYYAGGQRVAMRVNNGSPSYLFTDHLGSTTVTANTSGIITGELRYTAWGETRYTSGVTPTGQHYTGQIEDTDIGLYFYNARYYDNVLGRFVQADTVIPDPYTPLSYDRYAYANNSPINFNDPTGHCPICIIAWVALNAEAITVAVIAAVGIVSSAISTYHHIEQEDYGQAAVDVLFMGASLYTGYSAFKAMTPIGNGLNNEISQPLHQNEAQSTSKGGVYTITNPNDKIVRVGRTTNFSQRAGQYKRDPNYFDLDFNRVYPTDNYNEQRGLEQIIFEKYQPPMNYIKPISDNNYNKDRLYIPAANNYLNNLPQKE
jgi:RHS repeat-associated protein